MGIFTGYIPGHGKLPVHDPFKSKVKECCFIGKNNNRALLGEVVIARVNRLYPGKLYWIFHSFIFCATG